MPRAVVILMSTRGAEWVALMALAAYCYVLARRLEILNKRISALQDGVLALQKYNAWWK
jgi:hypothetical protein